MEKPFEITEAENAILRMHYLPTNEWAGRASVVADQAELNRQASDRVLDVLRDVDREFRQIDLGLV